MATTSATHHARSIRAHRREFLLGLEFVVALDSAGSTVCPGAGSRRMDGGLTAASPFASLDVMSGGSPLETSCSREILTETVGTTKVDTSGTSGSETQRESVIHSNRLRRGILISESAEKIMQSWGRLGSE
jgi:hypothetical protein